jgi:hypothetical protein
MLGKLLVELSRERHRRARRRSMRAAGAMALLAIVLGAAAMIVGGRPPRMAPPAEPSLAQAPIQPSVFITDPRPGAADIRMVATDLAVVSRYAAAPSRITIIIDDGALLAALDLELDMPTGIARIGERAQLTSLIDARAGAAADRHDREPLSPGGWPSRRGG